MVTGQHFRDLDLQPGSILQSLRSELQLRESEGRYAIPGIFSESPARDAKPRLRHVCDRRVETGPRPHAESWAALRSANRHLGRLAEAIRFSKAASACRFQVARRPQQLWASPGSDRKSVV